MLLLLAASIATGGSFGSDPKSISAELFQIPPVIDGIADDDAWKEPEASSGFVQFEPSNGDPATIDTTFKVGFDQQSVYFLVICPDPDPENIAAAITRRDGDLEEDDSVAIVLDTFKDRTNGFLFATNSLGTQLDGRIADNGRNEDLRWDAEWESVATRNDEGWVVEIRIPLETLRFRAEDNVTWGINILRNYPRVREVSTWNGPVEAPYRVSQLGNLDGLSLSKQESKKYEIIPYGLVHLQQNQDPRVDAGVDFRYRPRSDLSAELTINPDFATIEADVEQINLTRFELRIPEKRPFFQEGAEHFRQRVTQFYSRRIGDIPWGGKFTGKVGTWNLAFLAVQSDPARTAGNLDEIGENATYGIFRAIKPILGGSNVGFLVANRNWKSSNQGSVGLDATLFFTRTLGMTTQFVRSHGPQNDGALAWFLRPAYDSATTHFHVRYSNFDANLQANMNAVGFIRDDDRKEFDTNFKRTVWFDQTFLESLETTTNYNQYWSQEGVLRSWELDSDLEINLRNKWLGEFAIQEAFERFEKDFRNSEYTFGGGYDTRTGRSFSLSYGFGKNFDSRLRLLRGRTQVKITDAWNIYYSLTRLWLDPDPELETTLIHVLRSYYYFQNDLFVKVFYQTNSAILKRNAQVTFVWRFIPPFGALQIAYQHGTAPFGEPSDQGHTLFTKLSWVF